MFVNASFDVDNDVANELFVSAIICDYLKFYGYCCCFVGVLMPPEKLSW